MTTIFIDADACPVTRDAMAVARSHSLPVVLVANGSQNLSRYVGRAGVEILQVARDETPPTLPWCPGWRPGDLVVTADIGLAAMALSRGCRALSPRGRQYLPATHRRRTGGPSC